MAATLTPTEQRTDAVVLRFGSLLNENSEEVLFEFFTANKDLRMELTSTGDLIIMSPSGGETGISNLELAGNFWTWMTKDGTGRGFDSSTMFALPNGAKRSPDLAWVRRERWNALTREERKRFPPICPDFVVELRSPTDALRPLKKKMEEYIDNGAQLGWLIDPLERKFYVYRPQEAVEVLEDPETVSGDPVLPGFTLNVRALWVETED